MWRERQRVGPGAWGGQCARGRTCSLLAGSAVSRNAFDRFSLRFSRRRRVTGIYRQELPDDATNRAAGKLRTSLHCCAGEDRA